MLIWKMCYIFGGRKPTNLKLGTQMENVCPHFFATDHTKYTDDCACIIIIFLFLRQKTAFVMRF